MTSRIPAIVISVLVGAVLATAAWWVRGSWSNQEPEWLLSIAGSSALSVPNGDGTHTVTLSDVSPLVVAFTDRPQREADSWVTTDVVNNWSDLFVGSAPNAVLAGQREDGSYIEVPITVTSPSLQDSSLVFTGVALPGDGTDRLGDSSIINGPVYVFVDGSCTQLPSPG